MSQGPIIFDRHLLRARRARARALGPVTFLIERVAEDLGGRLDAVLRRFELALDLGTPTAAVRRVLAESGKVGTIITADARAGAPDSAVAPGQPAPGAALAVAVDEEALAFREETFDLIVSALALQYV